MLALKDVEDPSAPLERCRQSSTDVHHPPPWRWRVHALPVPRCCTWYPPGVPSRQTARAAAAASVNTVVIHLSCEAGGTGEAAAASPAQI